MIEAIKLIKIISTARFCSSEGKAIITAIRVIYPHVWVYECLATSEMLFQCNRYQITITLLVSDVVLAIGARYLTHVLVDSTFGP